MRSLDARRALLENLIDHAPTFPPAALPVAEALGEDARAASSPHAFVLARLVWPASLLGELEGSERALSVVLDTALSDGRRVAAVEARYRVDLDELDGLAPEIYVEVPADDALETSLDAVVARGFRAKVRCGGADPPSARSLGRFVRACRQRGLAFKATAGLHHALRTNGEHGLLNLLAAAVFEGDEDHILGESERGAFSLDANGLSWRDRHAGASELSRVRRELLWSVGSCSFFEPIGELASLGALPP